MSAAMSPQTSKLMRRLGLRRVEPEALTIRRRRQGSGYVYLRDGKSPIRDTRTIRRLARLAVPPAYEDVLYAEDPSAHLQAVGRDAAGRRQYRYHPDWEAVRERRKARRLLRLIEAMPKLRRAIARHVAEASPTRACALAAVIDLVACSAIRAGSEDYLREHGTRGAATLLKSNVTLGRDRIVLSFRAKLGKPVRKEVRSPRLVKALRTLQTLPGRRLFQYRDENGEIRRVQRGEVNAFLRELAGVAISLKDFRTLAASDLALVKLSRIEPAPSERGRRRQVREAMQAAADELANTPTICRKSYVHETILTAFEHGTVAKLGPKLRNGRSRTHREQVLAEILSNGS
jgi:DNA topoisomerase-1